MKYLTTLLLVLIPAQVFSAANWYKGNTHVHTKLCGHADSTPKVVAGWYHERDYNFLILSEHNKFIDPATVKLEGKVRKDFILIPGEEVTGHKTVHSTAMNIDRLVPWHFNHKDRAGIIQQHVNATRDAGGTTILNHPNYGWAVKAEDVIPVKHLHMFELYNGHPKVRNFGDAHHPSTEQLWDSMLTAGMKVYGVASDDAHNFAKWGNNVSNPGRGWVMVQSPKLTPDAITKAMLSGNFYSSSGVILKNIERSKDSITIEVDSRATDKELKSPVLHGRKVKAGKPGYEISFIGPEGKIIETVKETSATCKVPNGNAFLRGKVTLRKHRKDGTVEAYYAWTQPLFTDGR